MIDLEGDTLSKEDAELLRHPLVGGVILFSRNFTALAQLTALIDSIHALRTPRLLIAVDHEGGRVQRFRDGFTRLPAVRRFGEIHDQDKRRARQLAEQAGWVMAAELRAVGVDFSFAPVLDLDRGISTVIGDRAFHSSPHTVADLALAYMHGMQRAGMAAVGKHFPGHGAVAADSHLAIPEDPRPLVDILSEDVHPFERLIENGLAGMMPAHVIYRAVDERPAGFSPIWLQQVLRKELRFQGVIFSDDLNMEGASVAGDGLQRAEAALAAGCDVVLMCNNRPAARAILQGLDYAPNPVLHARLARLHGRHPQSMSQLQASPAWQQAAAALADLDRPALTLES